MTAGGEKREKGVRKREKHTFEKLASVCETGCDF